MAFNPVMNDRSLVVKNQTLPAKPVKKRKGTPYYMEWWQLGDPTNAVQSGTFHSQYIKAFVKMFMGLKKFNIIYLRRLTDNKTLWDRRHTAR